MRERVGVAALAESDIAEGDEAERGLSEQLHRLLQHWDRGLVLAADDCVAGKVVEN